MSDASSESDRKFEEGINYGIELANESVSPETIKQRLMTEKRLDGESASLVSQHYGKSHIYIELQ